MPSPKLVCAQALEPDPTWALFLDVDGTILRLAATPNGVAASKRVCQALRCLSASLDGAVALISGRTIDNLDRLFAPLRLPSAGLHGLERRDAEGRLHVLGEIQALEHLRPPFAELAASKKGVMLEDKGRALAIHYRKAPQEAESVRHQVDDLVRPSTDELKVLHGKMVSEVKPRHADKGSAIRGFMGEAPFEGRVPVFVGDDVTDEDGFAMVNGFDGYAIRVGRECETAARYRLADVDQTIAWLEALPSKIRARQG